ncbi:hypothetical protein HPB47_004266 [Ixodes persulcatus]|uniref:Uncharacterized protein n=1 Tax=Ixodes persulcatus TaxID=34615 RepID=A0AC60PGC9_IXOPE|nr:hypothetical protein HPB47_004266 [Ixodes persulcatus]
MAQDYADGDRLEFQAPSMALHSFRKLHQFFEDGELCDVCVRVGGRAWRCHRLVLACCSPYFHAMFTTPLAESQQQEVSIGDIDEVAMDQLIRFAYTGTVQLNVEGVQALLHASSVLQLDPLMRACSCFVRSHLEPGNALGVWQFAESHGLGDLARSAECFARARFPQVAASREYLVLGVDHLDRLLAAADLGVESETQIKESWRISSHKALHSLHFSRANAGEEATEEENPLAFPLASVLIKWKELRALVEGDCPTFLNLQQRRGGELPNLLARVRLSLLPAGYVRRRAEDEELLRGCHRCRDLLDEARDHQLWRAGLLPGLPPAPGERSRPRHSYAGTLFCVGGRDSNGDPSESTEFYSIAHNRWFKAANMTTRRRHVGAVSVAGKLFAVGGSDDKHHLSSAELFDPLTNCWKLVCTMNIPRRGLGLCQLGGPLYAVGGMDDVSFFNTVERYDAQSDSWTLVAPMKSPRGGVAVAVLRDCIYAVGGNVGQTSLNTCEKYDPHLNKWTYVAGMTQRRAGAGAVALDGFLFVVGGFDNNLPLSSVERYDPDLDRWVCVRPMSTSRGGVGVGELSGRLYAVGGHNGTRYLDSVEAYDPATDRWEPVASIHGGRAGPGVSHCSCPALLLCQLNRDENQTSFEEELPPQLS